MTDLARSPDISDVLHDVWVSTEQETTETATQNKEEPFDLPANSAQPWSSFTADRTQSSSSGSAPRVALPPFDPISARMYTEEERDRVVNTMVSNIKMDTELRGMGVWLRDLTNPGDTAGPSLNLAPPLASPVDGLAELAAQEDVAPGGSHAATGYDESIFSHHFNATNNTQRLSHQPAPFGSFSTGPAPFQSMTSSVLVSDPYSWNSNTTEMLPPAPFDSAFPPVSRFDSAPFALAPPTVYGPSPLMTSSANMPMTSSAGLGFAAPLPMPLQQPSVCDSAPSPPPIISETGVPMASSHRRGFSSIGPTGSQNGSRTGRKGPQEMPYYVPTMRFNRDKEPRTQDVAGRSPLIAALLASQQSVFMEMSQPKQPAPPPPKQKKRAVDTTHCGRNEWLRAVRSQTTFAKVQSRPVQAAVRRLIPVSQAVLRYSTPQEPLTVTLEDDSDTAAVQEDAQQPTPPISETPPISISPRPISEEAPPTSSNSSSAPPVPVSSVSLASDVPKNYSTPARLGPTKATVDRTRFSKDAQMARYWMDRKRAGLTVPRTTLATPPLEDEIIGVGERAENKGHGSKMDAMARRNLFLAAQKEKNSDVAPASPPPAKVEPISFPDMTGFVHNNGAGATPSNYRPHLCDQTRVVIARVLAYNREMHTRLGSIATTTPWSNPDVLTAAMVGFTVSAVRHCLPASQLKLDLVKCTDKGLSGASQKEPALKERQRARKRLATVFADEEEDMSTDQLQFRSKKIAKLFAEPSEVRRSSRIRRKKVKIGEEDDSSDPEWQGWHAKRTVTYSTRRGKISKEAVDDHQSIDTIEQEVAAVVGHLLESLTSSSNGTSVDIPEKEAEVGQKEKEDSAAAAVQDEASAPVGVEKEDERNDDVTVNTERIISEVKSKKSSRRVVGRRGMLKGEGREEEKEKPNEDAPSTSTGRRLTRRSAAISKDL